MEIKYGYSRAKYAADGSTSSYAVPFPYLSQFDVTFQVIDAAGHDITLAGVSGGYILSWLNANTVSITPTPPSGTFVWLIRNSSQGSVAKVDFQNAVTLTADDLDEAYLQALYTAQEALDEAGTLTLGYSSLDAAVTDAVNQADGAATDAAIAALRAGDAITAANNALTYATNAAGSATAAAVSAANAAGGVAAFGLLKANNLSDVVDAAVSRSNLGLGLLVQDAVNVLAQRSGANPQTFRIYNTYTDAANNERLEVGPGAGGLAANNVGVMQTQVGTGAARQLYLGTVGSAALNLVTTNTTRWQVTSAGHLTTAGSDNALDIGASGSVRPRSIYWGTQALAPAGSATTPSYGFAGQAGMGFYVTASSRIGWSVGALGGQLTSGGIILKSASQLVWGSDGSESPTLDLFLARDAAGALALRNGTSPEHIRLYGTYTDAANYERLTVGNYNAAVWEIKAEAAGTGTPRSLRLTSGGTLEFGASSTARWSIQGGGNFIANTDNAYDIGLTGANRPRSLYWGTQAFAPVGTLTAPAYSFAGDATSGWMSGGTNTGFWDYVVSGAARVRLQSGSASGIITVLDAGAPGAGWIGFGAAINAADVKLARDAANALAQRNGTNVQSFRIYGSYTDASNWNRATLGWTGTTFDIGVGYASTGAPLLTQLSITSTNFTLLGNGNATFTGDVSFPTTGGTTRTLKNRFRDHGVSVKDYGAVGDGVTDDTPAIQAAINSGANIVHFPAGSYRTTATITTGASQTLSGPAYGPTVSTAPAQLIADLAVTPIVSMSGGGASAGFAIRGLSLNRAAGTIPASSIGLLVQTCNNAIIEDTIVYRCDIAYKLKSALGTTMTRTQSTVISGTHLWVEDSQETHVGPGCRFGKNGGQDIGCNEYVRLKGNTDTFRATSAQFDLSAIGATRAILFDTYTSANGIIDFVQCHFEMFGVVVGATSTTSVQRVAFNGCTINGVTNAASFTVPAAFFTELVIADCPFWTGAITIDQCGASRIIGNRIYGDFVVNSGSGAIIGNDFLGNITVQGICSGLSVLGNVKQNSKTFTNTATGHVSCDIVNTSFTPVLTSASGTLTSASATMRYTLIGTEFSAYVRIAIPTNGTAAGSIRFTLPYLPANGQATASGIESALTGKGVSATWNGTNMVVVLYDGTYPNPLGNGGVIELNLSFDVAL